MCGIFGIVTSQEQPLGELLTEAARRLTYRGYDSVGIATLREDGTVDLRKDVGQVDTVAGKYHFNEMSGRRGITQLRWATFGEPSQVNAQPHLDSDGDMVGAHNGNVVNNVELRQQFIAEGLTVRSQNDGETCVHAVEHYINKGYDFIDAIRLAYVDRTAQGRPRVERWGIVKLAFSVQGLLFATVMTSAGYVAGSDVQSTSAVWGIRFLIGITPIVACLAIAYCMYRFPLGRKVDQGTPAG